MLAQIRDFSVLFNLRHKILTEGQQTMRNKDLLLLRMPWHNTLLLVIMQHYLPGQRFRLPSIPDIYYIMASMPSAGMLRLLLWRDAAEEATTGFDGLSALVRSFASTKGLVLCANNYGDSG